MCENKMLKDLENRLNAMGIYDVRQLARIAGVHRPSDGTKGYLIGCIMKIASGEADPVKQTSRGAPHKSDKYDRQIAEKIQECRELSLLLKNGGKPSGEIELTVGSGEESGVSEKNVAGILERRGGKWFLRPLGLRRNAQNDVFVHESFVLRFSLREGDKIEGAAKRVTPDEMFGLMSVEKVDGMNVYFVKDRANFDGLTPVYPSKQLKISRGKDDVAGRIIDFISPIGAGQRVAVIAPRDADKTALLKHIAGGIKFNDPEIKLIITLADVSPEEVTDYRRTMGAAEFFIAENGSAAEIAKTASLAVEYAKRNVELGVRTVLIVDDMTKLSRAFNAIGKQVSAGLDQDALERARRYFFSARNAEEGGSLTIITALISDGANPVDEAVFAGLCDSPNIYITLSSSLSRSYVFPPLEVKNTGSSAERRLLSEEHLNALIKLREAFGEVKDTGNLIALFNSCSDEEIISRYGGKQ